MVVTSLPSLGQGESENDFSKKKNLEIIIFFFAITIKRIRTFYSYNKLKTDIYTLKPLSLLRNICFQMSLLKSRSSRGTAFQIISQESLLFQNKRNSYVFLYNFFFNSCILAMCTTAPNSLLLSNQTCMILNSFQVLCWFSYNLKLGKTYNFIFSLKIACELRFFTQIISTDSTTTSAELLNLVVF